MTEEGISFDQIRDQRLREIGMLQRPEFAGLEGREHRMPNQFAETPVAEPVVMQPGIEVQLAPITPLNEMQVRMDALKAVRAEIAKLKKG